MSKIIEMGGTTKGKIPVHKVIGAAEKNIDFAVIVGAEKETGELYFASTEPNKYKILWYLEQAKKILLGR
jgi:hypothetical protein